MNRCNELNVLQCATQFHSYFGFRVVQYESSSPPRCEVSIRPMSFTSMSNYTFIANGHRISLRENKIIYSSINYWTQPRNMKSHRIDTIWLLSVIQSTSNSINRRCNQQKRIHHFISRRNVNFVLFAWARRRRERTKTLHFEYWQSKLRCTCFVGTRQTIPSVDKLLICWRLPHWQKRWRNLCDITVLAYQFKFW